MCNTVVDMHNVFDGWGALHRDLLAAVYNGMLANGANHWLRPLLDHPPPIDGAPPVPPRASAGAPDAVLVAQAPLPVAGSQTDPISISMATAVVVLSGGR